MREFLERAKKLGLKIENGDVVADYCDLIRDISYDRECFENAFLPTALHDRLLQELREKFVSKAVKLT